MVCHVVLFIVVPRARGRASGSLLQGVDGSTIWVLPIMLDSNNHRGSGPSGSLSESYCESDRIRTVASRHDWIPDVLYNCMYRHLFWVSFRAQIIRRSTFYTDPSKDEMR